ncbi:MAG: hypothetical protein ACYC3X_04515 [Pirellulaceae bacterium]
MSEPITVAETLAQVDANHITPRLDQLFLRLLDAGRLLMSPIQFGISRGVDEFLNVDGPQEVPATDANGLELDGRSSNTRGNPSSHRMRRDSRAEI